MRINDVTAKCLAHQSLSSFKHSPWQSPFTRFGVDPDFDRFEKIVKGKAREELRRFVTPDKMNIVRGGKVVQLPKPRIDMPHFTRGTPPQGGVGSGDGEEGDTIGQVDKNGDVQTGDPSNKTGEHANEDWGPEITRSEVARMIIGDLTLPNLKPKGTDNIQKDSYKWTSTSRAGSKFLPKQTLRNAMKRSARELGGELSSENISIEPQDIRYRSWSQEQKPQANAVIFYVIDVSGSINDVQKEMSRTANFYLSTIIKHQFGELNAKLRNEDFSDDMFGDGVEEKFFIHDSVAKEVSEKDFYTTSTTGGTQISSAYKLIEKQIEEKYNPSRWNIYIYHYSDGDNFDTDNSEAIASVERLLPNINELGYINLKSNSNMWANGKFKKLLESHFGENHEVIRTAEIERVSEVQFRKVILQMLGERKNGNSND